MNRKLPIAPSSKVHILYWQIISLVSFKFTLTKSVFFVFVLCLQCRVDSCFLLCDKKIAHTHKEGEGKRLKINVTTAKYVKSHSALASAAGG